MYCDMKVNTHTDACKTNKTKLKHYQSQKCVKTLSIKTPLKLIQETGPGKYGRHKKLENLPRRF